MAYSYFKYEGDGSTTTFAIPFALGILKKEDVTVHVGDEQNSSGQPIYRTWDFLPGNQGMIKIDGTPPKVGEVVRIERTVSKTQLVHDFQKGEPLDELSLDESHEQLMMAVQEALDGRGGTSIVDLDMNGNVIRNVGIDKTDPTSAINYGLYQALEKKMDDSYVNADRAETAATNAKSSELAAAESARQAKLSEQAAKASETAAATSESIASAAAAAAADDSAATADDRLHVDAVADEIKNLTVEATTLTPGQSASANYNAATGVLELGIPKGMPGDAAIATPTSLGSVMPQTGNEDGLELGEDGSLRVRKASDSQRGSVLASTTAAANTVPQAGEDGTLDESWTENCLKLSGGTLTGAVAESLASVTGEAVTLDLKAANNFTHNVIADTAFTVTANTGNSFQLGTLVLTNGGAFTITWPSSFKWADGAPPSLMESGIDVISFFTIDGGTTYYAAQAMTGIE